jgi:hypothetical protein
MLARLGQVLYWAGCGFGTIILIGGILMGFAIGGLGWPIAFTAGVIAAMIWLLGRAALFVLAGK